MRRAIIYYSLSGNTEAVAMEIAEAIDAELYPVEMVNPLPDAKWKQMLLGGRQAVFGVSPEITGMPEDPTVFDEIILGAPIWAGTVASPIHTVMDNADVDSRVTAIFSLSGSGNHGNCMKKLKPMLPRMKFAVALADKHSKLAARNEDKINAFIECIRNQ